MAKLICFIRLKIMIQINLANSKLSKYSRCDWKGHAAGHAFHIQPKVEPGDNDDERGGDERLDQVVDQLTVQHEFRRGTGPNAWRGGRQIWIDFT
jgi:hypothetical protein